MSRHKYVECYDQNKCLEAPDHQMESSNGWGACGLILITELFMGVRHEIGRTRSSCIHNWARESIGGSNRYKKVYIKCSITQLHI